MTTVKKVYPINGHKDFYKYIVTEDSPFNPNAKPCKDYKGDEMYFDDINKAHRVARARNKVKDRLKQNQ